jgi:predicted regulator of Ras-like GTPase activity (Roadblock/LC7/MglB family)
MPTLPQLLEEDIRVIDASLDDFLSKSEASSALILDKGGFIITQRGDVNSFDTTTLGALAAAAYAATQGIAGLVKEANFSSVYQQGETYSLLINNVDEHCLLVAIFRAQISVGAVKYYAVTVISQVSQQLQVAHGRAPGEGLDLSMLNVADTSGVFLRREEEEEIPAEEGDPNDPIVKLQRMKKLLAGGLITQEDFEQMKRRILEQM